MARCDPKAGFCGGQYERLYPVFDYRKIETNFFRSNPVVKR